MLIIVGLGNPGDKYEKTYHNVGFVTVDKIAARIGVSFKKKTCSAEVAECFSHGEKIILARPVTYMNNSGISVKQLMGAYHADATDVLIIYDDVDLECGNLRIRDKGSAGTHNGMRSVVSLCGETVRRIRIGIGKAQDIPLVDYVLSKISGDNKIILEDATERAAEAVLAYVNERDIDKIGAKYNGKGK